MMRSAILLLSIFPFFSRARGIEGELRDASGFIPFTTVHLDNHDRGAVIDIDGRFLIKDLKKGKYILLIRAVGCSQK